METVGGGRCVLPVLMLAISSSIAIAACDPCIVPKWCVMIDYVLVGFKDKTIQTETQKLCHAACKDFSWCESSNYEMTSGQCQLNVASHYDDSKGLVNKRGWVYSYTCLKDSQSRKPAGSEVQDYHCDDMTTINQDYPIFLTPEEYPSADLTHARERCAQCDMQLCSLAQLKAVYDAGYRSNQWGLVDTQGRDAKVTSCGGYYLNRPGECYLIVGGNATSGFIPNTPRPDSFARGYCCSSCNLDQGFPIFRTPELSLSLDLTVASEHCALCGMALCSLTQLKAAYDAGYRDYHWGLIDTLGQHAKVMSCDGIHNTTNSCFYFVEGGVEIGYIPLSSKTEPSDFAYCCLTCDDNDNTPIFFVPEEYPSDDLTQARDRCAQCDMQLCSLAQLKAAYDSGYRNENWGLYDTEGRDTKVTQCASHYFNKPGECYFTEDGEMESSIPNTPRPHVDESVYCCKA